MDLYVIFVDRKGECGYLQEDAHTLGSAEEAFKFDREAGAQSFADYISEKDTKAEVHPYEATQGK